MSTSIELIQTLAAQLGAEDVLPADVSKIEFVDGHPTIVPDEEANARLDALAAQLNTQNQSAPYPAEPIQSSQIANIPAVDRQVDYEPSRQPVDVRIVTSRIKNPG